MQLEGTGRYRILPNGNLVIRNVTRTDSGEYTCEARNKLARARRKGFLSVVGEMQQIGIIRIIIIIIIIVVIIVIIYVIIILFFMVFDCS